MRENFNLHPVESPKSCTQSFVQCEVVHYKFQKVTRLDWHDLSCNIRSTIPDCFVHFSRGTTRSVNK